MPYLDRLNRVCGFLDIEEKENSCRFQRRYFILDTQGNVLQWYMDNPQNLASGASFVGSLRLTYISKVKASTAKQKPKTEFCFVINAVSRRYYLQANDAVDMRNWVDALNKASKITVPKSCPAPPKSDASTVISDSQGGRKQQAYKTEIIGGVVVHTPIQNETEETEGKEKKGNRPGVLRYGFCVKQGNVRKSWKRRFFTLDDNAVSYYKSDTDKEPLRGIPLRDIQKVHECLVKSGDLLFRDNLFEIITNSRTFYIQVKTKEEKKAGNPGPQFPRVSRPSWTWRTKTARSVLSPLCLRSPPHPLPRPPHPPPTPCPPQPLAPVRPRYLRPAGWGCSQHRQMLLAAGDGTARSLSLTPPSPSAWMTTASAQQTCNAERSVQTLVWTKVLVPFLSDECD
uniref:PH domain-containing protein n=1 Tax=Xiphophorus couchianus TaxID=32473 RepID=A0A3B5MNH5_9TELE